MSERANAGRWVPLGLGSGGPQQSSAAASGFRAAPAGGTRASWEAKESCVCQENRWSNAGDLGIPFPDVPPLNACVELGVDGCSAV